MNAAAAAAGVLVYTAVLQPLAAAVRLMTAVTEHSPGAAYLDTSTL